MYMNAYHKVQGEVRMFEVDARNAIARFPDEWSAEPWALRNLDEGASITGGKTKKADGAVNKEAVSSEALATPT